MAAIAGFVLGMLPLCDVQAIEVTGTIDSDSTWTIAGSPYIVTGHVTVAEGATLTVQAGVTVRFRQYQGLFIEGTLNALGSAALPITFTGTTEAKGWWRGIEVTESGSANLDGCVLAHAGYWSGAGLIKKGSGGLSLKNSSLRDNQGEGLRLGSGYSSWISQNNSFRNHTTGVRLNVGASFNDATSTFTGNEVNVHADGGTITGNVTWNLRPEYSVYLSGQTTVETNASLTIQSGTVVKFAQYVALAVNGRLEAHGAPGELVHFTDWRDDAVGGDANGDGNETGPGPGWWRAIIIQEGGSATFTHCTLRYAGYWGSVGLHKSGSGNLTLRNCKVSDTSGHSVVLANSSGTTALEQSTFAANTLSGLCLDNAAVLATGCFFSGNGNYGILQEVNDSLDYASNQFVRNEWGSVGVNAGTLEGPMTWSKGGGDSFVMVVRGHCTVAPETTLTIEPGVKLEFSQYMGLFVQGTLNAAGTSAQPIVFTGTTQTKGWWRGIQVTEAGSADLDWCHLTHSGYWDGVGLLKTGSGSLSLKNSIVRENTGDGLRLAAGSSAWSSQNNLFENNTRGVRLDLNASFQDTTSNYGGNEVDIQVDGGTVAGQTAWRLQPSYALVVVGSVTVATNSTLTIDPEIGRAHV